MRIRGTTVGLLLLSVLAALWMTIPTLHPTSAQEWQVYGWLIVDFKGDPTTEWRVLWEDGSKRVWRKPGCTKYFGPRPNAAILRISKTSYPGRTRDTLQRWEAIARVGAATVGDLVTVEQYVETCYSHVDLYRIDEEIPR